MYDAVGIHAHPTCKLGRRPEDKSRIKIRFGDFVKAVPTHPLTDPIPALLYPMDHNDQAGDCVVAGTDHALQIIMTLLTGSYTNWSDSFLLKAYQSQNPGFKSWADAGGPNDGGMNVATFLDWCVKQKLILAYAQVDVSNLDEIRAAIDIGLAVVTGEDLKAAQQSGTVWDYVAGSAEWGGHCTVWGGYEAHDELVSWGSSGYSMTDAFIEHQVDEAYFVLTQAHVDHPGFRNSYDLAGFAAAVSAITNGKVVVPVTPTPPGPAPVPPSPPSPVADADKVLAQAARDWVTNHHHTGEAATVANAIKAWMTAKGLT